MCIRDRYMVVCIGSEIAMMTGIFLSRELGSTDPSRIAAQVISGIGFLGAGTILVTRQNQVKGLTTAAGLWADACLGLALGSGFYSGAIVGFAAIWCSLKILSTVDTVSYTHLDVYKRQITGCREMIGESEFVVHEPETMKGKWREAFGNDHPVYVEIGMGKGRFLMDMARLYPEINFIGIEKYSSVLLRAVQQLSLIHICIVDDGRSGSLCDAAGKEL